MDSQSPPPAPSTFRSSYAPPPEVAEARCTLKQTSAYHDQKLGKRFERIERFLRGETFEDEPPTGVVPIEDAALAAVRAAPPPPPAQVLPFPGSREAAKPFDDSGILSKSPLGPEKVRRVASSPDLEPGPGRPRRPAPSRPDDAKKPSRR